MDFSKESIDGNTTVVDANDQTSDHNEALCDLHSTFIQPIKCFNQTSSKLISAKRNIISILKQRELGLISLNRHVYTRYQLMDRLLPNKGEVIATMIRPTFCGQFSDDGQRFYSACQDCCIRLYDTQSVKTFKRLAEIPTDDVGWSILDTAISPSRDSIAYSTWSDCIYLVHLNEHETQSNISALQLQPHAHSFSIFSLQFSANGSEIIGGSNDTSVYVYDLQKQRRTLCVSAHEDDVNAVRFVDNSNSLIVSGSDDNLIHVWDRRALNESDPKPVGTFAGHTNGITFLHSRMDTRYIISNSKDQSIKLWDMRRFANENVILQNQEITRHINSRWDYRYDSYGPRSKIYHIKGDPSVRTYRGHSVRYTLIRCYFSPAFSTGQKYIITGSSDGAIHIYDVLTGDIKLRLHLTKNIVDSREKCVRDVSWHPHDNYIISTSWASHRAHVRWIHSLDNQAEQQPPSEQKDIVKIDGKESPPKFRPTTLRQLLIQQFLGDFSEYNSDDVDDDGGDSAE